MANDNSPDAHALAKFVRRCRCLRKFPPGHPPVWNGRGKANSLDDAQTLWLLRHDSRAIGIESRRLLAAYLAAQKEAA